MLKLAATLTIVALLARWLGQGALAVTSIGIARTMFLTVALVYLVSVVVELIERHRGGDARFWWRSPKHG
jgi:uncharacterized membrane protein YtjA (UPF0391 family)